MSIYFVEMKVLIASLEEASTKEEAIVNAFRSIQCDGSIRSVEATAEIEDDYDIY